jgi:hypothetical protein
MGPVLAIIGMVPALIASHHGEKQMKQLVNSGRLSKTQGPLARLTELKDLWGRSDLPLHQNRDVPRLMMHKMNQLVDEVLPSKGDADAQILRRGLKMTPQSVGFDWLNHAFQAKRFYAQKPISQPCRELSKWGSKVPFAPVRLMSRLPELLTMLPITALNLSTIQQMARHV